MTAPILKAARAVFDADVRFQGMSAEDKANAWHGEQYNCLEIASAALRAVLPDGDCINDDFVFARRINQILGEG